MSSSPFEPGLSVGGCTWELIRYVYCLQVSLAVFTTKDALSVMTNASLV